MSSSSGFSFGAKSSTPSDDDVKSNKRAFGGGELDVVESGTNKRAFGGGELDVIKSNSPIIFENNESSVSESESESGSESGDTTKLLFKAMLKFGNAVTGELERMKMMIDEEYVYRAMFIFPVSSVLCDTIAMTTKMIVMLKSLHEDESISTYELHRRILNDKLSTLQGYVSDYIVNTENEHNGKLRVLNTIALKFLLYDSIAVTEYILHCVEDILSVNYCHK